MHVIGPSPFFLSRSSFTNRVFLGTVIGINKKNCCLDQGILKMGAKNVIKFFAPAGNIDLLRRLSATRLTVLFASFDTITHSLPVKYFLQLVSRLPPSLSFSIS